MIPRVSAEPTHEERCPPAPAEAALPAGGPARARQIRRVFVVTLALNLGVAVAKAIYSLMSGSLALGTDAIHSGIDGSSNLLALLGLHLAARPADAGHPYGRRKIEIVTAVGIGVLIVIGLFEFATAAVRNLLRSGPPPEVAVGVGGFAVVLSTMVVNGFVTRYERKWGEKLASPLLCADARHTQSDLYVSGAVLVAFISLKAGLPWADSVGALVVVVLVGHVAWEVFRDNLPVLTDAAVLDPARVVALAASVDGVQNIHRVRSRGAPGAVHLDLHMQVRPDLTVAAAHEIAHEIEQELRRTFPELCDVVVHIEPGPEKL